MVRPLILALLLAPGAAAAQQSRFELPDTPPYAGEIFPLAIVWEVDWARFQGLEGPPAWAAAPLVADSLGLPERGPAAAGRVAIRFETRAMALEAGDITLARPRQTMLLETGRRQVGDRPLAIISTVAIRGSAGRLQVRPLPPAPAGFSGAVGRFKLASSVDKARVRAGEVVTWRLTLSGEGNWPALAFPARAVGPGMDLLQPPRLIEEEGASLFVRTRHQDLLLQPQRGGTVTLGPVTLPVFDPSIGRYRLLTAPAIRLAVDGSATTSRSPETGADVDALPRPIGGSAIVPVPVAPAALAVAMMVALFLSLLLWIALAVAHAERHDPARQARTAHRQLRRLLDGADEPARVARAWQQLMARRLSLPAAPLAETLPSEDMQQLWREADAMLYAPAAAMPSDWTSRAGRELARIGAPPPFRLTSAFTIRNLWPAVLVLLLLAPPLPGSTGAHPRDWIGHHDRALRLAAAGEADAAAMAAAIAWVQAPGPQTAALRDRLEPAAPLPALPRTTDWAWQLSAPRWQHLLLLLLAGLAATAGLLLAARFQHVPRRWGAPLGLTLLLLLPAVVAVATALLRQGSFAHPDAAIVRAGETALRHLPVDDPAEQPTTVLARGQAVRLERCFLDWVEVVTDDDARGWLKADRVTAIWATAPHAGLDRGRIAGTGSRPG